VLRIQAVGVASSAFLQTLHNIGTPHIAEDAPPRIRPCTVGAGTQGRANGGRLIRRDVAEMRAGR